MLRLSKGVMAAIAAGALVLLAGCSATGSTPGDDPSQDVVKIGIITPLGTAIWNSPGQIAAANAAVDALNDRGGLDGHPVELVYCNDKGDPNVTSTCARQMVADGVIALTGGGTLNGNVIVPILEDAGIPMIGASPNTAQELNASNAYLFSAGTAYGINVAVAWAASQGLSASLIASDNPTAAAYNDGIASIAEEAGSALAATVKVSPTQADFAPIVAAAAVADGAVLFIGDEQLIQFATAVQQAGEKFEYVYNKSPVPGLRDALGDQLDDVYFASAFPPFNSDNPLIQQYVSEMAARADGGDETASTELESPQADAFQSWLGVYVIEKLVNDGTLTELTAAGLKDALDGTVDLDLDGVIPPWTPSDPGPEGMSRVSNLSYFLIGFEGGETAQLSDEAVTVEDLVSGDVSVPLG